MSEDKKVLSSMNWERALILPDTTVQEAIRNLDETALQIALVVSKDRTLMGTITDGDIRRGLLRGLKMNSSVAEVIYRNPVVAPPELGRETVLQLMQANKIHQLPVVDDDRKVVGLHLLDELMAPGDRSNPVIIMAGGQGSRLRPHTENCPKPLLPVGGKPILEHIITRASSEGFKHFAVAVHYLGEMIENYFQDGKKWGVKIQYLREKSPLGTAGAIALLSPRPTEPFLVTNGDVLADINYAELLDFHCRHQAIATMAVRLYEWQHPFGVVHTNGVDIIGLEEKPISLTHVNSGIYVLDPDAQDELIRGEHCDMPTLFGRLQGKKKRTIAYPMHEPWLDIGRADDLQRAHEKHLREI